MTLTQRFDTWALRSPVDTTDLAAYRILFCVSSLLILPDVRWIARMPASAFEAPRGPFRLLTAAPEEWALVLLQVSAVVFLVLLAVGMFTRTASAGVAIALVTMGGLNFSFGKIDHSILWAIVPAILLFSGWGNSLSFDAGRAASPPAATWPPRLLALATAVSFAWSGIAKAATGWLDPSSHTAAGYVLQDHIAAGDPVSTAMVAVAAWPGTEIADWLVVLLEVGALACVVSWPSFRVWIAVLCLFHAAIALALDIHFGWNIIVYGAFVSWSRVPLALSLTRWKVIAGIGMAGLGIGALFWSPGDDVRSVTNIVLVSLGSVVAALYLVRVAVRVFFRRTP